MRSTTTTSSGLPRSAPCAALLRPPAAKPLLWHPKTAQKPRRCLVLAPQVRPHSMHLSFRPSISRPARDLIRRWDRGRHPNAAHPAHSIPFAMRHCCPIRHRNALSSLPCGDRHLRVRRALLAARQPGRDGVRAGGRARQRRLDRCRVALRRSGRRRSAGRRRGRLRW